MFESLTLPLLLTAVLSAAFLALVYRYGGIHWVGIGIVIAAICVTPAFLGLMTICDHFRYGVFQYADASGLEGSRVDLPKSATSIQVHFYPTGHAASFEISEPDLRIWMGKRFHKSEVQVDWESRKDEHAIGEILLESRQLRWRFDHFGWPLPDDAIEYLGDRADDGAGTNLWYSPSTQRAFVNTAYW
ncbi:hypothetical protein SH661x_000658 [Planctomicrobium sp. SH661]|uniref:hypothetical protein n=1 Tax=Planctomicrobium sp. SH661 TaxID=3448124 RepID=UPI003F5B5741